MSPQLRFGWPVTALQSFLHKFSHGESLYLNDYEVFAQAAFRAIEERAGLKEARRIFGNLGSAPTPGRLREVENAALLDDYDLMEGEQSAKRLARQLAEEEVRDIVDPATHERQLRRLLQKRNAIPGQEELHRILRAELEALRRDNKEMVQSVEELAHQLAEEGAGGISEPAAHEERIWRVLRERNANTIEAVRTVLEALRKGLTDTE
jgi:hypothetical protein